MACLAAIKVGPVKPFLLAKTRALLTSTAFTDLYLKCYVAPTRAAVIAPLKANLAQILAYLINIYRTSQWCSSNTSRVAHHLLHHGSDPFT